MNKLPKVSFRNSSPAVYIAANRRSNLSIWFVRKVQERKPVNCSWSQHTLRIWRSLRSQFYASKWFQTRTQGLATACPTSGTNAETLYGCFSPQTHDRGETNKLALIQSIMLSLIHWKLFPISLHLIHTFLPLFFSQNRRLI